MQRIKIAQIGTSQYSHGSEVWNTLRQQDDIYELVGFALPENEREKFPNRMVDFKGYREMTVEEILNDPEITAVAVETEEIYQAKYALAVLNAGKHLHLEKPGSCSLSDFENIVNTAKEKNLTLSLGYMYRFNPVISDAIERVKKGELGEIISVEAQMNCAHSKALRSWLGGYKGGSLFFLGCHLIDLIFRIQGTPEKIIPLSKPADVDGVCAEDFGMAIMEYKHGISFAKVNSNEVGGFDRRQLVVSGTKKTVELKPLEIFAGESQFTTKTEYKTPDNWGDRGETSDSPIHDRYDPMMHSFAEMVCGKKQNPYTPDYELELYKTILKCCGVE